MDIFLLDHGALTQLHPGEGYRYFTSSARTVHYPLLQSFVVEPYISSPSRVATASIIWSYDEHLYPDNQTVIADLYYDNNIVAEGLYTVGAFVGNDCRGVGRYIDGHLFMTIHGTLSDNEVIEFKAYDHIKDSVCQILESNSFSELQLGTLDNPYEMHLVLESTGLVNPTLAEGGYNVFPKPLRDRMYIIGPTEQITSLSLISVNGLRLLQRSSYSEGGIDVSSIPTGVYIVVISTATKTYWDKVTKY